MFFSGCSSCLGVMLLYNIYRYKQAIVNNLQNLLITFRCVYYIDCQCNK